MLHHISIGVADVERAARFYDSVLEALGYKRVMEFLPYAVGYGDTLPEFWIQLPLDQHSASAGNGTHVAFTAENPKAVHAFHEAALAAGAKDEGAPGPRPEYSPDYYGAFVRDSDGNKIEAVFFAMESKPARSRKAPARRKAKAKAGARKAAEPARKAAAKRGARGRARKR